MVHPRKITVVGSSSLLAHDPRLGDPGGPLELSMDVDVLLDPCEDAALKMLHEAVGEGSIFHRESGVYADLMRPAIVSTLPAGWETRCITLPGWPAVKCLDRYDLLHELNRDFDIENGDGRISGDSPPVVREKRVCYKARTASTAKRPTKLARRKAFGVKPNDR